MVAALALFQGCASSDTNESSGSSSSSVATVAPTVTSAVTTPAPEYPPTDRCAEPYAPLLVEPICSGCDGVLDLDGEPIDSVPVGALAMGDGVDLDHDGTTDVDLPTAPAVTVRRPAGDITFERVDFRLAVMSAGPMGDPSGDAMWVLVLDTGGIADSYVVPYDAPGGTHDPATVGKRVPPGLSHQIDDRDDDGVPDLLSVDSDFNQLTGTTRVLSTAAIIATAVGGDARGASVIDTIDGAAVSVAELAPDRPVIITLDAYPGTEHAVLRVSDGDVATRFTTLPETLRMQSLTPGAVQVVATDDGPFLTLTYSDRSGGASYAWSLDAPCTPP